MHLYLIFHLLISFYLKGVSYSCLLLPSVSSVLLFDQRNDRRKSAAVLSFTKGAVTVIKGRLCSLTGTLFDLYCLHQQYLLSLKNMCHSFHIILSVNMIHILVYFMEELGRILVEHQYSESI